MFVILNCLFDVKYKMLSFFLSDVTENKKLNILEMADMS